MSDEIKEIFETKLYFDLEEKDYIKIQDYITNLQQELEEEKRIEQESLKTIQNLEEENEKFKEYARSYLKSKIDRKNEELELVKTKFIEEHNICYDYKSRVEKAVEYINKNEDYFNNYPLIDRNYILTILQGEKDE